MKFTVLLISWLGAVTLSATPETTFNSDGFALPKLGRVFEFPRDHGSHDEFKIEWWYITGHLFRDDGARCGFQATFFRSAAQPIKSGATNDSAFDSQTLFLAHMALLDVRTGKFFHQQRLNRRGWDADAARETLAVRNGNWSLHLTDTNRNTMALVGSVNGDATFELQLTPAKPLVVFGSNSVSRKAAEPSAASYYLTWPRLTVAGKLTLAGKSEAVRGEAWMDHEISSSQLGAGQAGWDWCSVQLKDGREIMAYRMRRTDGSTDPFSTLAWISTNGVVTHQSPAEFAMETVSTWKSPATGANYPVSIRLKTKDPTTGQPTSFVLEPLAREQELTGGGNLAYWEGSCRVRDERGAEVGSAFLELTGYAGDLGKSLR